MGLISYLKIQYLEHQRDQILKTITKTYMKEALIETEYDIPEMKEIRRWRQQAKRKKQLKKRDAIEEKIRHKKEKQEGGTLKMEGEERETQGMEREKEVFEEVDREGDKEEREDVEKKDEETERIDSLPEMGLILNLKIHYLEHQRDQILKTISKTYKKEALIEAGGETPEWKEIWTWRQQGKRKKLLKKQQAVEKRIQHIKEKTLKRKTEEKEDMEEEEENEEKEGRFSKVVTGIFQDTAI